MCADSPNAQPENLSESDHAAPIVEDAKPKESDHRNRPKSEAFLAFMKTGWGGDDLPAPELSDDAPYAQERRRKLGHQFLGKRLVIPAGPLKVRSNDTDYRFRPHSAFAHLTGLGVEAQPDSVLVLNPREGDEHDAVLYVKPNAGRDSEEFFTDSRYGEFWVGRRPTLAEVAAFSGIETRDIANLRADLLDNLGSLGPKVNGEDGPTKLDILTIAADPTVSELVAQLRAAAGFTEKAADGDLTRAASELRLVKDAREIEHLQAAVDSTIDGFAAVIRELPRAVSHPGARGERVVETTFDAHARLVGNTVGYETIAAAGPNATTLHWIDSTGAVKDGELLLLDAGVEDNSLYTADITRTLPISGKFTELQRRVYQAVYDACQAAFAAAQVGNKFVDVHNAAMEVIAARLQEWGLLPEGITAEISLDEEKGQHHRRWMVHGTSHHLGLDVHDCAHARNELYKEGILEPGMVFTIEPGLYFKQ
ncbi:MAG: aminopeptidase P N-terminal domain-containing protein, partial [Cellulomonadaceae bacterium]|nr:aminopeptidase P N-terminal domain-containing protein [Cellulomonadaceae bacterium]